MSEHDAGELVGDVEGRLAVLEEVADPSGRQAGLDAVQALVELYGAGLERIVEEVAARDDGTLAEALAGDELVAHLLLLHGLHPVALEDRVRGALDEVRPYLESHGGDVELREVEGTAVRLRLSGSCHGCPSSTMTLKLAIEDAIRKAAPEIEEVVAEDPPAVAETAPLLQIELAGDVAGPTPVPLAMAAPEPAAAWTMAGSLSELSDGATVVKRVGGEPVLFARVGAHTYGYRPSCPACGDSLAHATLDGSALSCPGCGERYDVVGAGRGLGPAPRHLEPLPLLVSDDGLIKVALPAAA